MLVSFHERLQSLGAEYDRVIAENAAFRRKVGNDVQRHPSMPFVPSQMDPAKTSINVDTALVMMHAENIGSQKHSAPGDLILTSEVPDDFQARLEDVPGSDTHFGAPTKPMLDPFMLPPGTTEPGVLPPVDKSRLSTATVGGDGVRATIVEAYPEEEQVRRSPTQSSKPWSAAPATLGEEESKVLTDEDEVPMAQLIIMDIIPAVVIILNSIVLGVQADVAPESVVWDVFEILFTLFFVVELVGKTIVSGPRAFFCGIDWYWSWFDTFCVFMALVEMVMSYTTSEGGGGIMGIMKMLKLFRLGRVVRLLKFKIFAELKLMVQGVFTGLRVLLWAVVLLVILMYLLAMVGRTLYGAPAGQDPVEDQQEFAEFATVFQSWLTMFRCFTEGCADYDGRPLQERLRASHGNGAFLFTITYFLVFLFISIGIFNLIMAVFIDSVNDGSLKKKQRDLGLTAEKTEYTLSDMFKVKCLQEVRRAPSKRSICDGECLEQSLKDLCSRTGTTMVEESEGIRKLMERHKVIVSQETFTKWLYTDKDLIEALNDADIDLSVKFDLFDVLDSDLSGELDFGELINGLMKCRGPVSKNDVIAIRNKVGHLVKMVTKIQEHLCPEETQ